MGLRRREGASFYAIASTAPTPFFSPPYCTGRRQSKRSARALRPHRGIQAWSTFAGHRSIVGHLFVWHGKAKLLSVIVTVANRRYRVKNCAWLTLRSRG